MGRMKELFMEMQERDLHDMALHEYLAMRNHERAMQEPEPHPEDEMGDEYWQEKANLQEMYEKDIQNEIHREAELPRNKRIPPCAGHDFQKQEEE